MKFIPVKGTRDFYPEQMRLRNWIADTWRRVSLRNGFEEYDAPIFEYLDLLAAKSGPEIAEQLFSFTDRGGRNLAIRPEITPSLARMVNAKISSLRRPIKWFSIPRLCRAENPQKGRLREFFQWNVDIIGPETEVADAECVFVAVDALREMGLTAEDAQVRYSSRTLLTEVLGGCGVAPEAVPEVLSVLDKRNKLSQDVFAELLAQVVPDPKAAEEIAKFMELDDATDLSGEALAGKVGVAAGGALDEELSRLRSFAGYLDRFGIGRWCRYDPGVVRNLAYYTGIVYEVFDAAASLRAVAGGGRYDELLGVLGGPRVTGTGFGMGDVVLEILLREKGKMPDLSGKLEFFVIDGGDNLFDKVLEVVGALRGSGLSADFSFKRQNIGKQLKEANRRRALKAVIVREDGLAVKDLSTGNQQDVSVEVFLASPNG